MLLGAVTCAFVGKVLKRVLRVSRPEDFAGMNKNRFLGRVLGFRWPRGQSYGMPSSHANALFYFVSFLTLESLYTDAWPLDRKSVV